MRIRVSRSSLTRQLLFTLLVSITCGSLVIVHAGLRGRGKYSGVFQQTPAIGATNGFLRPCCTSWRMSAGATA